MFVAFFLIYAVFASIAQAFGWQAASFDLNDPEAARAKYEEIGAIESLEEQGRAWCSLTDRELRAIAKHTEMSNTITTTTHTSSMGETTASTVIEPAPNQVSSLRPTRMNWWNGRCAPLLILAATTLGAIWKDYRT